MGEQEVGKGRLGGNSMWNPTRMWQEGEDCHGRSVAVPGMILGRLDLEEMKKRYDSPSGYLPSKFCCQCVILDDST